MVEPPKPKSRRGSEKRQRTFSVRVRLDEAEHMKLEERAGEAGLSLSAFLRASGLGSAGPRARRRPTLEHELLAHTNGGLNRIGSNLNQSAKALNVIVQRERLFDPALAGRFDQLNEPIVTTIADLRGTLGLIRKALGYDSEG